MVVHPFLLPVLRAKQFYNLNEGKYLPKIRNLNMEEISCGYLYLFFISRFFPHCMKLEKLKYLKHYTLIKIVAPKKTLPLKIGVI